MNNKINLTIKEGVSSKTNKPYECLLLEIGDWKKLVFPATKFEMDYIKKVIEESSKK